MYVSFSPSQTLHVTHKKQMYVMSSLPPGQQSLAGGIFNTVTKICLAVGLGISASIYNAESSGTAALQTTIRPYTMVFWFGVAVSGASLIFVPFLTIGTQGHSTKGTSVASLEGNGDAEGVVEREKGVVVGDKEE
jgi:hypothetical protein